MPINASKLKAIAEWQENTLDLSNCNLNDEDLKAICCSLKENKNIKCLLLGHNQITSKGAILLADELSHIESLVLSYNNLNDSCLFALATSKFKLLDLSWNNITNKGVDILIQHSKQHSITVTSILVSKEKQQELSQKLTQREHGSIELTNEEAAIKPSTISYYFRLCTSSLAWCIGKKTPDVAVKQTEPPKNKIVL